MPPLAAAAPVAPPVVNPFAASAPAMAPEVNPFFASGPAPLPSAPCAVASAPSPPFGMPMPAAVRAPIAPTLRISDDIPDLLDGRTRSRRALFIVVAMAAIALIGTIAAAIASHYRPM
jgi:hypothetical protein